MSPSRPTLTPPDASPGENSPQRRDLRICACAMAYHGSYAAPSALSGRTDPHSVGMRFYRLLRAQPGRRLPLSRRIFARSMRIGRTLGCPNRSLLCGRCSQRSSSSRLASSESVTLTTVNAIYSIILTEERPTASFSTEGSFRAIFFYTLVTVPSLGLP
jgi:hypothetical protein